jgi:hypothetical protein
VVKSACLLSYDKRQTIPRNYSIAAQLFKLEFFSPLSYHTAVTTAGGAVAPPFTFKGRSIVTGPRRWWSQRDKDPNLQGLDCIRVDDTQIVVTQAFVTPSPNIPPVPKTRKSLAPRTPLSFQLCIENALVLLYRRDFVAYRFFLGLPVVVNIHVSYSDSHPSSSKDDSHLPSLQFQRRGLDCQLRTASSGAIARELGLL